MVFKADFYLPKMFIQCTSLNFGAQLKFKPTFVLGTTLATFYIKSHGEMIFWFIVLVDLYLPVI